MHNINNNKISFLDRTVPFWVAKVLKRIRVDYPGSMVYDRNGNVMWIGGLRRKINMLDNDDWTSAPTWGYLINLIKKK